jgi:hypothetical protein
MGIVIRETDVLREQQGKGVRIVLVCTVIYIM